SDVRFDYSRVHTRPVAGGLMAIPAFIGGVQALAIIDTGSERTLGNVALRRALHLQDTPGKLEPVAAVYGATSQVETGRMVSSPVIAIGPLRVAGVDLIYGNFHIFKVWGLESRPAIILGMDVLGTVDALGFDFRRHDLFVGGARPAGGLFSTIQTFRGGKASGGTKVSH
ncbi:MAG: aspartyl protease family protein, partial [Steroidobacteraceae bacterium]